MSYLGNFKIFGLALAAMLAISAVTAASASAITWYARSPETVFVNGQEETVTPSIKTGTNFTLEGKVGTIPLKISAKELTGEAVKIKQEGTTATDSGRLIFKELKVSEPSACTPPAKIETNALKSELVEVAGLTSGLADRFRPATGEVFAQFKLGGTCAIAGTIIQVKTTSGLFAETGPLGTFKAEQPLKFSSTINEDAGGNLFTGSNAAKLTGESLNTLSGEALGGKEWGAIAGGTMLCKAVPAGRPLKCPAGEGFAGVIGGKLQAGTAAEFRSIQGPKGVISCAEVLLIGKFEMNGMSAAIQGGITSLAFTGVKGGLCTSTLGGNPPVSVEPDQLPYNRSSIIYIKDEPSQGAVALVGERQPELLVTIDPKAVGEVECRYKRETASGDWTNGAGAGESQVGLKAVWKLWLENPLALECPNELEEVTPLNVSRMGGNVYVAKE